MKCQMILVVAITDFFIDLYYPEMWNTLNLNKINSLSGKALEIKFTYTGALIIEKIVLPDLILSQEINIEFSDKS